MPRTFLVNAVDVALAAPVAAPDLTITVDDAAPLPPTPFYLVVDPFNDTDGREYMLCTNVAGVTLTVTRNLEGTDSDTHQTGDIVRITIAQQHIDDLWDSIEAGGLPAGGITGDSLRKLSVTDGDAGFRSNVTFAISEPASPLIGDLWMDTDDVGPPGGGYLPLGGGTMLGDIDMGLNDINNGGTLRGQNWRFTQASGAIKDNTAINRFVVTAFDTYLAGINGVRKLTVTNDLVTSTVDLDMSTTAKVINMATPVNNDDAATKAYVDGFLPLDGSQEMQASLGLGGNSLFNTNIITAQAGSDLIISAFSPNVLALSGLIQQGTVWENPAAGGIIQEWGIDGNVSPGSRIAQWRRSIDFGQLEL
ncbi:unnamed protein product, partial [marine sediment metagenome]